MKFTSEDLMKAMGLSVGDRVKIEYIVPKDFATLEKTKIYVEYEVVYNEIEKTLCLENDTDIEFFSCIVGLNFEILPKPKRVGDLKCGDNCDSCHIRAICNGGWDTTLYKILEYWKECDNFDQEIYDLLIARLDKEVVEE